MENSSFVADAEWNRYINQGWARFRGLVSLVGNHDIYLATDTFATVAGTAAYALPAAFLATRLVTVNLGGDYPTKIHEWRVSERHRLPTSEGWVRGGGKLYYRRRAANLEFRPAPLAVHSVTHEYLPAQTDLAADADTLDGFNGWEEWIVLWAARKAIAKEESDTTQVTIQMDEIKAEVLAESANLDEGEGPGIVDVTGRWLPWGGEHL